MLKFDHISIWGDSILKGIIWDTVKNKYCISKMGAINILREKTQIKVKNFSKFGCTSSKAIFSLKSYLDKNPQEDAALIELGGNDCDHVWQEISQNPFHEHHANVCLSKFTQNINYFISELMNNGIQPILMNLPPIDSNRYFNWITSLPNVKEENIITWLKEKSTIYRNQEMYSYAIEKISHMRSVPLIDVRSEFLSIKNLSDYLCVDGIHLSELGHKFLGDVFCKFFT